MQPTKRDPLCDAAVARLYDETGDITTVANHFSLTETEAIAAVLADIRNSIPRKPPTPAKGLFVVRRREAA